MIFEAATERDVQQRNMFVFLAWHTAALSRQERLPPLHRLMAKFDRGRAVRQSWEEQLATMDRFAARMNAAVAAKAAKR